MQILEKGQNSDQRMVQKRIEQPITTHFSKRYKINRFLNLTKGEPQKKGLSEMQHSLKEQVVGVSKDEVIVRVTNLDDHFDSNHLTYKFDAREFAHGL